MRRKVSALLTEGGIALSILAGRASRVERSKGLNIEQALGIISTSQADHYLARGLPIPPSPLATSPKIPSGPLRKLGAHVGETASRQMVKSSN